MWRQGCGWIGTAGRIAGSCGLWMLLLESLSLVLSSWLSSPLTCEQSDGGQALGQWRGLFGGYFIRFHQRLDVRGSERIQRNLDSSHNCLVYRHQVGTNQPSSDIGCNIADMHVDPYQRTLLFAQALIESCISGASGSTEEHL